MSRRKPLLLMSLVLLAIVVPTAAVTGAADRTVKLQNIAFSSKSISIPKGTLVTFRWLDEATDHNVSSVGAKRFKSIGARSSGSRSVRFFKAGAYRYVCTLHPGMSGRITVR